MILWWDNQTAAAEESLRTALALRHRLVAGQPRSAEFRLGLASVLTRLGEIPAWNLDNAAALALYQQALPILQALAQEHPQDAEVQIVLTRCLSDTAIVQKNTGDYPGATKNLTAAEAVAGALARREPNNFTARNQLWFALYNETEALLAQKAVERALEICPRMLEVAESLAKSDPENAASQHNLAASHDIHGEAMMQAHRWLEALDSFQAALALDARLLAATPTDADSQRTCGLYHTEMARAHLQLGETAFADADAQTAQDLLESVVHVDPDNLAPFMDLVRAYELRGDICERRLGSTPARQWFQRAVEVIRSRPKIDAAGGGSEDWIALRRKLTEKTAAEFVPMPTR